MSLAARVSALALLTLGSLVACQGADVPEEDVAQVSDRLATSLVSRGSSWRFFDQGAAPAGWNGAGFSDAGWKQGPGQIGYGDGDEATVASYGSSPSRKHVTTYFRKSFQVADASKIRAAALELLRDDGAVVYLNGREVLRSNMPAGAISFGTRASSTIAGSAERAWVQASIAPSAFVTGTNVIAVEVHQSTADSSDLSFDLGLTATVEATTPPTSSPCLPFAMPSVATLRGAPRKVFAHYFSPYPLSLDNRSPDVDYYARHYLQPSGENGKFAYCGGLLKQRPLPQPARSAGVDYEQANFEEEVRRAIAIGIDGFTYDILNHTGTHWNRLLKLLAAARAVDPAFKVVLMPDMTSTYKGTDDARAAFVESIRSVASHPSVYKLPDGRLLLSPFAADRQPDGWWAGTMSALAAAGIRATLWPVYVNPWETPTKALDGVTDLYGTSSWGGRTINANSQVTNAQRAHALGLKWMTSVAPQDSRPKDLVFTEANNTRAMRALWDAARTGEADWVQLVTWNDYSEATEFSPSSGTQWAIYDLTAYYLTWFKTGNAPTITRDALYYSHRSHATTAQPDLTKQRAAYRVVNGQPASDEVELLAFLTAPATLKIRIGTTEVTKDVPAGVQSFRVPLREGTPSFTAVRDGKTVASVQSAFPIRDAITYQDMLYRSGGSITCDRSALMR